ncbi:hypothetical protein BGW38_000410 [Lunasporangiospora selenospora]|uniref:Uncharacterized protein n=1 Tax=Lunasporangiospora selenospora TaxID=979761 RepID=A0A9P6G2J9_9FUNG|nr:hypothetical protein BGW38_000410 [Lunasporangiospora selenospora]
MDNSSASADPTLYYKAVGSIAVYFITVISALVVCIARTRPSAGNAFYILTAICSLFTTWYYILSFFKKEYESLGSDLNRFIIESDLFVQAYAIVTNTLPKWWWSSQLLLLTGTALTCWSVEGQTLRTTIQSENSKNTTKTRKWTPTWWFVLLGFFGSMSVGGPLFLAQLDSDKSAKKRSHVRSVPVFLALLILLGELSVIATPFLPSMTQSFKYNLVLTHVLFLLPALLTFNPESQKRWTTFSLPRLYFFLSLIGLLSQIFYSLPFAISPIMKPIILYRALWFNHCQTSISADMVFNTVLTAFYMVRTTRQLGRGFGLSIVLTILMPILSVSTVLPLFLAWRERQLVERPGVTAASGKIEPSSSAVDKKKKKN